MENLIELTIVPERELFYDDDFGVYACSTDNNQLVNLNSYGNFVISGQTPQLAIGRKYNAKLKEVNHKKYGKGYQIVSIFQELPTTIESQHAYLRSVLTESQAEAIIAAYPTEDIIGMVKADNFDYSIVKGVGEKTYKKIRAKIIDNFEIQEALVELSQYGITYRMIKKLIDHFGGSPALVVQKVKENPYVLCEVNGLGFIKVDEYALQMGVDKESPYRIQAAVEYILQTEESNGHCWIDLELMKKQLRELTGVVGVEDRIENLDRTKFWIEKTRIGSKKIFDYESRIKDSILELLKHSGNFKVDDVEERIKATENEQGFKFTEEQRRAIYEAIKNNVIIISGKAGTGKSTILKGIMKVLSNYSYETCAFSGKASQRIVESTGLESKTIHRLLEYRPNEGFYYNQFNKLPVDIVVLDEASMVNTQLFYNLAVAINKGSKFIILGDIEQLPPIGAGNVMRDLVESGIIPTVELTQVHRQALKSGILLAANNVREGKQITSKNDSGNLVVGELKDLQIILKDESEEIFEYIKSVCIKSKALDIMDFQVIAPMKTRGLLATKNLNLMLQEIFNPEDKPSLKRKGFNYKVGDKVIKVGNDKENKVFNGTLGLIEFIDVEEKLAGIRFVGSENVTYYSQDELDGIEMAYALTVHRTQGSQFKNVIFAFDYSAYILLSRQLVYTGLTRTSKKCVLVCENRALRFAISRNDSSQRNTYLKKLLLR